MRRPDLAHRSPILDTSENAISPVVIAVIGLTGVGKSRFISLLGCQHVRTHESSVIGSSLNSGSLFDNSLSEKLTRFVETKAPDYFVCERRGRKIYFIDTPGFDDSLLSNSKVLRLIAQDLAQLFKKGKAVDGVLYLHRITDNRMGGHAKENVELFEKLCGEEAMKRVTLLTTMWDAANPGVPGFTVEAFGQNEEQLIGEHWSTMIKEGATPLRSLNTPASAMRVLDHILDKKAIAEVEHTSYEGLRIQEELVTQKMELRHTSAGSVLAEDFHEILTKMRNDEEYLKLQLAEALSAKERGRINEDLNQLKGKIQIYQEEQKKFFNWSWVGGITAMLLGLFTIIAAVAST